MYQAPQQEQTILPHMTAASHPSPSPGNCVLSVQDQEEPGTGRGGQWGWGLSFSDGGSNLG